uniref:tripartite motif-containing protein 14-like isoform X2 n=1 Tax=Myxine glutinosa TaxID=7769 RepID=UPI00358F5686
MSSEEEGCFVNILSRNRSNIVDALLHGPQKAFDQAKEEGLLEREDLDRITNKESNGDKIRACLDIIEGKGNKKRICEKCGQEAAKRCVTCGILCCDQHLKRHQQEGHNMMDPGVKIEKLRCTVHGDLSKFYCMDDWSLICPKCKDGQHKEHEVVPMGTAPNKLKVVLAEKHFRVLKSIESNESQLHEVQEEEGQTQNSGRGAEDLLEKRRKELCQIVNETVDLMKGQINKRKMEKLSLLGKQKEKLEQQNESLHQEKSLLQTALQEELDTASFLQDSKDLLKRLETMSDFKSVERTPLPVLDFSKEEKNLDGLITLNKNFLEKIEKGPVEHPEKVELDQNNLRRLYGRSPSLDPNSAHRRIKISGDLRTTTRTWTENQYPEHPDRFDVYPQVVTCDCFSSGRHYWEVDVRSSRLCRIGICLNSMGRKGGESGLGENPESWCLEKCNNKFSAYHNDQGTSLSVPGDHERFGFFLDCEAGELTCFGDSRVLHVFRGNFMDPVKPAIGVYYVDGPVHFVHLVK